MDKKFYILLVLSLFIPAVIAQEDISEQESLDLSFSLSSSIFLKPESSGADISSLKTEISFFPSNNERQQVREMKPTSNPAAQIQQDASSIVFSWQNPVVGTLQYSIDATVNVKNKLSTISSPINLPINQLPQGISQYTEATEFIDLTPAIEQQAREIVGSETDLWKAVFKLADWTKTNVKYNLTTLTAEVVQPSSWVLLNRKGVCDEITNLFISMVRSLGIPAKFVSGTTYSNNDNKWSAHGWAEVYFPGYGWIPFDVTFGQYGWMDATHLKLKESLDSGSPSASYTWKAKNLDVELGEIKIDTILVSSPDKKINSPLEIKIFPQHSTARFGSVVPLEIQINNKANYYVSTSLHLRKAPGVIGSITKEVLLLPKQSQAAYFLIQIPQESNSNYLYTSELEIKTSFGDSSNSTIRYGSDYPFYSKEDALKKITQYEYEQQKPLLEDLSLKCTPEQQIYYRNDLVTVHCNIISQVSRNIKVCVSSQCKQIQLSSSQPSELIFSFPAVDSARLQAVAEDSNGIQFAPIDIKVIDIPSFYITSLKPKKVSYKDNVEVSFMLNSDAEVKDVNVFIGKNEKPLGFTKFENKQEITITARGSAFINGIPLRLEYKDAAGKAYYDEITLGIEVTDIPWYMRLIRKMSGWLS